MTPSSSDVSAKSHEDGNQLVRVISAFSSPSFDFDLEAIYRAGSGIYRERGEEATGYALRMCEWSKEGIRDRV